jgi:hypothetical protein
MRRFHVVVLAVFVAGCTYTSTTQYRSADQPIPPITIETLEHRQQVNGTCSELLFRRQSVEDFTNTAGSPKADYSLGVIELSDDGHIKDIEQKKAVFKKLQTVARGDDALRRATKDSPGAVVVVFVHGWHHRAKVCDENLSCFRRVLQGLSLASATRANGAPVFGIYVGWRGESARKLANLTFFNRKKTAHHVGERGGAQLLLQLNELQHDLDDELTEAHATTAGQRPARVTMITVGHSFGGALVYSAMESLLVKESKGEHVIDLPASNGVKPRREGIGDLVVLVNPAFEAERYRYFAEDLTLPGRYESGQLPVMLTVASEADKAVGQAFPAGRTLWLLVHPNHWSEWRAQTQGLGHFEPYVTHVLDFSGKHPALPGQGAPVSPEIVQQCGLQKELEEGTVRDRCGCSYNLFSGSRAVESDPQLVRAGQGSVTAPDGVVQLRPIGAAPQQHVPFLVAKASPELINGHNDIYNPNFVAFLLGYMNSFVNEQMTEAPKESTALK